MSFRDNVRIDEMSAAAEHRYNEIRNNCSKISQDLNHKLEGRSRFGLVGALLGTIFWIAVYGVFFLYVKDFIEPTVTLILLVLILLLLLVKVVDVFQNFRYYGALLGYRSEIESLIKKIDKGKNAISSNESKFSGSGNNGWNLQLGFVKSIPAQAERIKTKVANMESFKNGFIKNAKTALFFAVGVAVTVAGSLFVLESAMDIIYSVVYSLLDYRLSDSVLFVALIIIMVIACIAEIILSRLVWGLTDCNVTNITLLMTAAGPLIFALLAAAVTIVALLLAFLVILLIAGIAIAIAVACCSGG